MIKYNFCFYVRPNGDNLYIPNGEYQIHIISQYPEYYVYVGGDYHPSIRHASIYIKDNYVEGIGQLRVFNDDFYAELFRELDTCLVERKADLDKGIKRYDLVIR